MYQKIIRTEHIIEIYEYEKLNPDPNFPEDRAARGLGIDLIENYAKRQQIRKDTVRRLVTANFNKDTSRFITLTFKDTDEFDIKNVKQCNLRFQQFTRKLKLRFPEITFQYIAVLEFQDNGKRKRGAVHYHMISNVPFIPHRELQDLWGQGFVYINKIKHVDNVGAYVVKYMTKDTEDPRLMGLKAYNCSKGLIRPVELKSWKKGQDQQIRTLLESLPKEKVVYRRTYTTENAGQIGYLQVNLNR